MADALSELSMPPPVDPEAQAAVTDFLDYTEFFPSDLYRSLSLIGKLDQQYKDDTAAIHDLTKTYSTLPSIPQLERPRAQSLRKDVSHTLDHALRCREATYAEANRLCIVADNLYSRLVSIKAKLVAMPTPPSRDPTPPPPKDRTPQTTRLRRNDGERTPRLKLFVDTEKANNTSRAQAQQRQKNRVRRLIVPGEVMPPFDPNSPGASLDSESESDLEPSPVKRPTTAHSDSGPRDKSGALKLPKLKVGPKMPKTPRVRPHGVMGTNVHSQVAGISVSNAMASLTPPPEVPEPGSEWAPWLDLTEWELHKIRKKMKKNANWQPSEIMKRRALEERGRGPKAKKEAQEKAEAEGAALLDEEPHRSSGRVQSQAAEGLHQPKASGETPKLADASSLAALATPIDEPDLPPEAEDMDENQLRILRERQEMARMTNLIHQYSATVEKMLGNPVVQSSPANESDASPSNSISRKPAKKRKREDDADAASPLPPSLMQENSSLVENGDDAAALDAVTDPMIDPALLSEEQEQNNGPSDASAMADIQGTTSPDADKTAEMEEDELAGPQPKKLKLVAARPEPKGTKRAIGVSVKVPLAPPGPSALDTNDSDTTPEGATSARPRRAARPPSPPPVPASKGKASASAADPKSGSISIRLPTPTSKDAPPTKRDPEPATAAARRTSRRVSGNALGESSLQPFEPILADPPQPPTHTKNKSVESTTSAFSERPPSRRSGRRTSTDVGAFTPAERKSSSSKSPGLRATPPSRKPSKTPKPKRAPDEPRYCMCGDLSYGDMVACENGACPIEWFHLGCVGLEKRPSVRETWYCPRCRDVLGVDVRGEPVARDVAESVDGPAGPAVADDAGESRKSRLRK